MRFRQLYILNEKLAGNKFYLFLEDSIETTDISRINSLSDNWMGGPKKMSYIQFSDQQRYTSFRKNITNATASFDSNFIYQPTKNLKLWVPDAYHFEKLFDEYLSDNDKAKEYFGQEDASDAEWKKYLKIRFDEYKGRNVCRFLSEIQLTTTKKDFSKEYDGFLNGDGNYPAIFIFWDTIKTKLKLIDGIKVRLQQSGDANVEIPPGIKSDLTNYTDMAKRRLGKASKIWAKENLPRKDKKLYRGMAIGVVNKVKSWRVENLTVEFVEKYLKKRLGISSITDLVKGKPVTVKRSKETSWSTTPIVGVAFAQTGETGGDFQILLKSDIKKEKIIIDFTELSTEMKKDFKFTGQNEVIVDTGAIKSKIAYIGVSKQIAKWLLTQGYVYKKNQGIFKK